jgi:S1-C subfamily serine protease
MREHEGERENEREQDPAYESGGGQPPAHEASSEQPPAHGTAGEQPSPGDQGDSRDTDIFWAGAPQPPHQGGGQPGYGDYVQPPGHESGAQHTQAFPLPASGPPPAYSESWQAPGGGAWPPPPGGPYGPWGTPPSPPRRRGRRVAAFAVVAILGIGIGAAAAFGLTRGVQPAGSNPGAGSVPTPGSQRPPLQNTGTSKINVPAIANSVSPSVANITSKIKYRNETAEGTGIVISSSGLVLTNNHVVNGATQVTAQIDGTGHTYSARVLGTDKTDDVALLQLAGASGLKAASIGDSSKVAVGDAVVALGNEGGQGGTPTVTSGAITNLNRTITAGDQGGPDSETLHGMLQTDAHIASGDSGGPLVNASGQVIGMDTAASSSDPGQSASIGFAIPIDHALSIARQIAGGHGSSKIQIGLPAFLGVDVCNVAEAAQCLSNGFGNPAASAPVSSGALIAGVLPGTPAQAAGITTGDVITAVDGVNVTSKDSLTKTMRTHRPGQRVRVTWVDTNGQRHTATVTLITGPAS